VQLHKLGVSIRLGSKTTAKRVQKDSVDVVVIATGAVPSKPEIPGVERRNVATAWDVLGGKVHVGEQVVVIGGNALGLETADFLATQRSIVDVVEMLEHVGKGSWPHGKVARRI